MQSSKRYPIPRGRHRVEDEVKRSRFITTIDHATSAEHARAFIATVRKEFPDATHNCWAFACGPPGSTGNTGAGDDGEPGGSAGQPMLKVLLGSGVGDVVAVITRYFGGTKLGVGGLVRAYSGGVQHALRDLPRSEHVEQAALVVTVDYAAVETLKRLLARFEAKVMREEFEERVTMHLQVPVDQLDAFEQSVTDSTRGSAVFRRNG